MIPESLELLGDKLHQASENIHHVTESVQDLTRRTREAIHHGTDVPTSSEVNELFLRNGILKNLATVHCSVTAPYERQWQDWHLAGKINRIVAPIEHVLPGVAGGIWLATGEVPLMHMQNSGLSNAMDGIITFLMAHKIPALALVTWRGNTEEEKSEVHQAIGRRTKELAKLIFNRDEVGRKIRKKRVYGDILGRGFSADSRRSIKLAQSGEDVCLLMAPEASKGDYPITEPDPAMILETDLDYYEKVKVLKGKPLEEVKKEGLLSRGEVQGAIGKEFGGPNTIFCYPNGFNAREAQGREEVDSRRSIYNSGYYGGTPYAAWAIAKCLPFMTVVDIEGDGNVIASKIFDLLSFDYPPNLYMVTIDNRIGESVGQSPNQPLAPWVYELTKVYKTRREPYGSFEFDRVGAHGVYFEREVERYLAKEIGALPALAQLWRMDIQASVEQYKQQLRESVWFPEKIIKEGIPTN